jgi:hypothetical protein
MPYGMKYSTNKISCIQANMICQTRLSNDGSILSVSNQNAELSLKINVAFVCCHGDSSDVSMATRTFTIMKIRS